MQIENIVFFGFDLEGFPGCECCQIVPALTSPKDKSTAKGYRCVFIFTAKPKQVASRYAESVKQIDQSYLFLIGEPTSATDIVMV